MPYHVLTHSGKAHMDELLAIALLAVHLDEEPETLTQKQSQEVSTLVARGEIPENTYIIDVGLMYDPARKLYDHHQDGSLDSSVLLIFNQFFSHLKGTEFHEYVKLVSRVDTQGIKSLDDVNIINESKTYWSFTQFILLRLFEKEPYTVLRVLIAGLKDKIDFEQKTIEGGMWLAEPGNIDIVEVGGINVMKYNKQPPVHLVSAVRAADSVIIEKCDITATYSYDDKDPESRILFRTNRGADKIDFMKASPQKSLFAHKGGFLLRFIPANETEWESLIISSINK